MQRSTIIILVILGIVFFSMFFMSSSGWGYAGYGGWHAGPTFFFFGGPRYYGRSYGLGSTGVRNYGSPSVRSGSLSGSRSVGGGSSSGK